MCLKKNSCLTQTSICQETCDYISWKLECIFILVSGLSIWSFYLWYSSFILGYHTNYNLNHLFQQRESIPYWRLYRFGQWYDIFRIPVNSDVLFPVYRYYIYIYIYVCVCVCVCVCIYYNKYKILS